MARKQIEPEELDPYLLNIGVTLKCYEGGESVFKNYVKQLRTTYAKLTHPDINGKSNLENTNKIINDLCDKLNEMVDNDYSSIGTLLNNVEKSRRKNGNGEPENYVPQRVVDEILKETKNIDKERRETQSKYQSTLRNYESLIPKYDSLLMRNIELEEKNAYLSEHLKEFGGESGNTRYNRFGSPLFYSLVCFIGLGAGYLLGFYKPLEQLRQTIASPKISIPSSKEPVFEIQEKNALEPAQSIDGGQPEATVPDLELSPAKRKVKRRNTGKKFKTRTIEKKKDVKTQNLFGNDF